MKRVAVATKFWLALVTLWPLLIVGALLLVLWLLVSALLEWATARGAPP